MADLEVNIWKTIYDYKYQENRETITIPEFFEIIKSEKYKVVIEKIRAIEDKEERDKAKEVLPNVTISGTFKEKNLLGDNCKNLKILIIRPYLF